MKLTHTSCFCSWTSLGGQRKQSKTISLVYDFKQVHCSFFYGAQVQLFSFVRASGRWWWSMYLPPFHSIHSPVMLSASAVGVWTKGGIVHSFLASGWTPDFHWWPSRLKRRFKWGLKRQLHMEGRDREGNPVADPTDFTLRLRESRWILWDQMWRFNPKITISCSKHHLFNTKSNIFFNQIS